MVIMWWIGIKTYLYWKVGKSWSH